MHGNFLSDPFKNSSKTFFSQTQLLETEIPLSKKTLDEHLKADQSTATTTTTTTLTQPIKDTSTSSKTLAKTTTTTAEIKTDKITRQREEVKSI